VATPTASPQEDLCAWQARLEVRRAVSAIGRGFAWLVEIGFPILYLVAIVAITRWVAEEGGLPPFLGICTVTVIGMVVRGKLLDDGRDHHLRMSARILVRFGPLLLLTASMYSMAWATKSTAVVLGWFAGLLVWLLGMRVFSIREAVRGRAGKQAE
jgi:hypothetical protein